MERTTLKCKTSRWLARYHAEPIRSLVRHLDILLRVFTQYVWNRTQVMQCMAGRDFLFMGIVANGPVMRQMVALFYQGISGKRFGTVVIGKWR